MFIDGNHGELRLGDARPCSIESLCVDHDLHRDARPSEPNRACVKLDDLADLYGSLEIHPIDRCSHPAMEAVPAGLDVARLVDVGEDDASKDCPLMVGVARHHQNAQRKSRRFDGGK